MSSVPGHAPAREVPSGSVGSLRLWALSSPYLAGGGVFMVALALRLWSIHSVPGNAFYDAAVRSMSHSWHNFFFGALEPGGSVSIDKPPLDLWLQVAATAVLHYNLIALHLPEALGGAAACVLLFALLRAPFGQSTALVGALTLALLPVAVLTSRSDTMDSLMAALQIAAVCSSWLALRRRQLRWSILAGAIVGLAFNVKLAESLIVLPALVLLWAFAAPARRRALALIASLTTLLVVAFSWALIASLTPVGQRPFPIGSHNGSIWHTILIYDGLDRVTGHGVVGAGSGSPGNGPGPLRLLSATGPSAYGTLIGLVVLATVLLGALALAIDPRRRLRELSSTPRGRLAIALILWLLCGLIFFSFMRRLQVRYLEALAPPLCACLALALVALIRDDRRIANWLLAGLICGLGGYVLRVGSGLGLWVALALVALSVALGTALWRLRGAGRRANWILIGALLAGLLAVPLGEDLELIAHHGSDSVLDEPTNRALSRYLAAHDRGTRFELASANVYDVTGLISRDDRPLIMLNDVDGELERVHQLRAQVLAGEVRFYFAAHGCSSGRHCPGNERWAHAHSVPVAHYPGLRRFDLGRTRRPVGRSNAR